MGHTNNYHNFDCDCHVTNAPQMGNAALRCMRHAIIFI